MRSKDPNADHGKESFMKISCDDARTLVPGYLDGELPEGQASPLRGHLMDCPACREVAKQGKNLSRWFEAAPAAVPVPAGFAARVARRAFAGDPGLLVPEPPAVRPRKPLMPFLLAACAVAAVLLFVLALAIRNETLPRANSIDAQVRPPWLEQPSSSEPAEARR